MSDTMEEAMEEGRRIGALHKSLTVYVIKNAHDPTEGMLALALTLMAISRAVGMSHAELVAKLSAMADLSIAATEILCADEIRASASEASENVPLDVGRPEAEAEKSE